MVLLLYPLVFQSTNRFLIFPDLFYWDLSEDCISFRM